MSKSHTEMHHVMPPTTSKIINDKINKQHNETINWTPSNTDTDLSNTDSFYPGTQNICINGILLHFKSSAILTKTPSQYKIDPFY